jgi:hypothetical protein
MSTNESEDREFEGMLRETPMSPEAPEELKRKLRTMAAGATRRTRSHWSSRLAYAGAASVVIASLAMLIWPTQASAKTLQRVVDATDRARSFVISVLETKNGQSETVKIAGIDGRVDIQAEKGERVQIASGKISVYDPTQNTLMVIDLGGMIDPEMMSQYVQQGMAEGIKQADIKKMVADFKARYGEENARISDIYTEDGRQVFTIDLAEPTGDSRTQITVDANTDLPTRIQTREKDSTVDMRLRFGVEVRIEPIESAVPKGVKRVDLDLGKMIQEGLAGGGHMVRPAHRLGKPTVNPDPEELQRIRGMFEGLGKQMDKH